MLFYGVVSDSLDEAIELFANRLDAERVVADWNQDEPDHAGQPPVEPIDFPSSPN